VHSALRQPLINQSIPNPGHRNGFIAPPMFTMPPPSQRPLTGFNRDGLQPFPNQFGLLQQARPAGIGQFNNGAHSNDMLNDAFTSEFRNICL